MAHSKKFNFVGSVQLSVRESDEEYSDCSTDNDIESECMSNTLYLSNNQHDPFKNYAGIKCKEEFSRISTDCHKPRKANIKNQERSRIASVCDHPKNAVSDEEECFVCPRYYCHAKHHDKVKNTTEIKNGKKLPKIVPTNNKHRNFTSNTDYANTNKMARELQQVTTNSKKNTNGLLKALSDAKENSWPEQRNYNARSSEDNTEIRCRCGCAKLAQNCCCTCKSCHSQYCGFKQKSGKDQLDNFLVKKKNLKNEQEAPANSKISHLSAKNNGSRKESWKTLPLDSSWCSNSEETCVTSNHSKSERRSKRSKRKNKSKAYIIDNSGVDSPHNSFSESDNENDKNKDRYAPIQVVTPYPVSLGPGDWMITTMEKGSPHITMPSMQKQQYRSAPQDQYGSISQQPLTTDLQYSVPQKVFFEKNYIQYPTELQQPYMSPLTYTNDSLPPYYTTYKEPGAHKKVFKKSQKYPSRITFCGCAPPSYYSGVFNLL